MRLNIFFSKYFLKYLKLSSSNRSGKINLVKKTKVVQNLILHLLGSSKYFSIVKYFFYSNFNILKAFFSKRTTSLSQRTMRSVWHWFRAQFATDLMSCQIFYYFLCLRTVWWVMRFESVRLNFERLIRTTKIILTLENSHTPKSTCLKFDAAMWKWQATFINYYENKKLAEQK